MSAAYDRITPSAARRQLGNMLRIARIQAGLSLSDAAYRIQRSAPTLSRLENGIAVPRVPDVRALVEEYRMGDPVGRFEDEDRRIWALVARARQTEWFESFSDILPANSMFGDMRRLLEFEGSAVAVHSYGPDLVPIPFQTPSYISAMFAICMPGHSDRERDRFVDFSIARQRMLRSSDVPAQTHVILGEAALRRVVGGSAVMREQLTQLLSVARAGHQNETLRIAPLTLAIPAIFSGRFTHMELIDDDARSVAYYEGHDGVHIVRSEAAAEHYRGMFDELTATAMDSDDSAHLIEEALDALI